MRQADMSYGGTLSHCVIDGGGLVMPPLSHVGDERVAQIVARDLYGARMTFPWRTNPRIFA
jgi:hypothetical protein